MEYSAFSSCTYYAESTRSLCIKAMMTWPLEARSRCMCTSASKMYGSVGSNSGWPVPQGISPRPNSCVRSRCYIDNYPSSTSSLSSLESYYSSGQCVSLLGKDIESTGITTGSGSSAGSSPTTSSSTSASSTSTSGARAHHNMNNDGIALLAAGLLAILGGRALATS